MNKRLFKNDILQIFLQALGFLALSVFLLWTGARLQTLLMNPFGLDSKYYQIQVSRIYPQDEKDLTNIKSGLLKIAQDTPLTLIYDNVDAIGLGIFDTADQYGQQRLLSGRNFSCDDFQRLSTAILIRDGSFATDRQADSIQVSLKNVQYDVIGIYDQSYPLYSSRHHFLYNYLTGGQIVGNYYIQSADNVAGNEFNTLLIKNQFDVQIIYNGYEQTGHLNLKAIFSDIQMIMMASGILFICVSFVFYYLIALFNAESLLLVSLRLGATKHRLLMNQMRRVALNALAGCLVGIVLHFAILLPIQYMVLPWTGIAAAVFLHLGLTLLLFRLSFALAIGRLKGQGYYYV